MVFREVDILLLAKVVIPSEAEGPVQPTLDEVRMCHMGNGGEAKGFRIGAGASEEGASEEEEGVVGAGKHEDNTDLEWT